MQGEVGQVAHLYKLPFRVPIGIEKVGYQLDHSALGLGVIPEVKIPLNTVHKINIVVGQA